MHKYSICLAILVAKVNELLILLIDASPTSNNGTIKKCVALLELN